MDKKINIENLIHHFGLDHLEVYGTFFNEDIFNKLDCEELNKGSYINFTIFKRKVPKYLYKITFKQGNKSLFAYYKGVLKSKKQPVATRDYIVVYSTGFKLLGYDGVLNFIETNLALLHCRRFDICIDLRIDIDELLNNYFSDYKTGRDYRKSGHTGTRYFGEKDASKNKRQLIRVYNKIFEIFENEKVDLYQEYLTNNFITRIELEIRPELAKVKSYKKVFDNDMLTQIFKNYLLKYTDIFNALPGENMTLYRARDLKLTAIDHQSLFYKTGRYNYFIGAARKMYELGFCPVSVLLHEGLAQDKTKYVLGTETIHDLIMKEKLAIRTAKENIYTRQNISEILDNQFKYGKL